MKSNSITITILASTIVAITGIVGNTIATHISHSTRVFFGNSVKTRNKTERLILFDKKFPAESCSDSDSTLLKDLNFYPIYAKYTSKNLITIKSYLCEDAFVTSTKDGKVIQVASFVSYGKARGFVDAWNNTENKIDIRIGGLVTIKVRGRDFDDQI